MNNFEFIHIGKCGGSTVSQILRSLKVSHNILHIQPVNFDPNKKYVILLRNPIQRFISAFNWRCKLVLYEKSQLNRFVGEKNLLEKYQNVNQLAESLFTPDGFTKDQYIHHIHEDINFYLENFLKLCSKKNILAVITTETLDSDIKSIWNRVGEVPQLNKNKESTYLSELGYQNLKQFLKKDYECIDKLYEMGLLTMEKYKILSV